MHASPDPELACQLIRASDLHPTPWKNEGGITREILIDPPDAGFDNFVWRISTAEISRPGPFSRFDGIDRLIVPTSGGAMMLIDEDAQVRHALQPAQPLRFAGETAMRAELPAGTATRDFNLMWRRTHAQADLAVRHCSHSRPLEAGHTILYCVTGAFRLTLPEEPAIRLGPGDTLHLNVRGAAGPRLDIEPLDPAACLLDATIRPKIPPTPTPESRHD